MGSFQPRLQSHCHSRPGSSCPGVTHVLGLVAPQVGPSAWSCCSVWMRVSSTQSSGSFWLWIRDFVFPRGEFCSAERTLCLGLRLRVGGVLGAAV